MSTSRCRSTIDTGAQQRSNKRVAVKARSAALLGVEAVGVDIETQIIGALRRFVIVGLPDGVLREARDRVRCATENSGFSFPYQEVVVSLAPASLPKCGSGFDLAIALSVLAAAGQVDPAALRYRVFLGELALDGSIKPVPGVLAVASFVKRCKGCELFVAENSAGLAALIDGVRVIGARNLLEVVSCLNKKLELTPAKPIDSQSMLGNVQTLGFGDVVGQHAAKRAVEVAAAGGHNVFFIGPPGAGKSMLARRILSIIPPMNRDEMLEVTKIYSALSVLGAEQKLSAVAETPAIVAQRPFRAPHHSTSTAGLIGGGTVPMPGEVSLAHKGVLFLDEFMELRRETLESLREPLETKQIVISRVKMRVRCPADFVLVAATNPCPCGKRGSNEGQKHYAGAGGNGCQCPPNALRRYFARLSGPMLDRIDLSIWVPPVPVEALNAELLQDPTEQMRQRVEASRKRQAERLGHEGALNSQMNTHELKRCCALNNSCLRVLETAAKRFEFSARGYTRVLKVARTIADIEESANIECPHVSEALSYRVRSVG
jgi:magnesium chelatase family protein